MHPCDNFPSSLLLHCLYWLGSHAYSSRPKVSGPVDIPPCRNLNWSRPRGRAAALTAFLETAAFLLGFVHAAVLGLYFLSVSFFLLVYFLEFGLGSESWLKLQSLHQFPCLPLFWCERVLISTTRWG